jgi:FkbM family methyltransferase
MISKSVSMVEQSPIREQRMPSHGRVSAESSYNQTMSLRPFLLRDRRAAAVVVLQRLLVSLSRLTPVVAVERDGRRIFISTKDESDITKSVLTTGTYEAPLIANAVETLARLERTSAMLTEGWFIDVGANIGVTTLEMFHRHGASRGLAIEPHPEIFSILRHNLLEAGLNDVVRAYNVAISSGDGSAELAMSAHNQGDHRLVRSDASDSGSTVGVQHSQVDVRGLDSLLQEAGIAPLDCALVWVDTQGHEPQVLAGARTLIAAKVPFVCEYWPTELAQVGLLAEFHRIVAEQFDTVVDLSSPNRVLSADSLDQVGWALAGPRGYTNLLLIRR